MEAVQIDSTHKTYSLSCDEPHMSFTRQAVEVSFKSGDQIIVKETESPSHGLVLVSTPSEIRLCRLETINGVQSIFPPLNIHSEDLKYMILGQVVDHIRLSKWICFNNF